MRISAFQSACHFLFAEAVLFGLFTLCMMGDQSSSVFTNHTQIDRLKNVQHDTIADYNEVFAARSDSPFQLEWILPNPTMFPAAPDIRRDKIFGYCLEVSDSDRDRHRDQTDQLTEMRMEIEMESEMEMDPLISSADGQATSAIGLAGEIRKRT